MPKQLATNPSTATKETFPTLKIVAAALVMIAVVALVLIAPSLVPLQNNSDSNSDYTTLSLVPGISQIYTYNGTSFVFSYKMSPSDESGLFI
jgi:hypothetical protein